MSIFVILLFCSFLSIKLKPNTLKKYFLKLIIINEQLRTFYGCLYIWRNGSFYDNINQSSFELVCVALECYTTITNS